MQERATKYRVPLFIQNLFFWPLFLGMTALFILLLAGPTTVVGLLTPRRFTVWFIRRLVTWYGRLVMWCAWPFVWVRYRDLEPKLDAESYILICNHRSSSDPFLMACMPCDAVQLVNDWPLRLPVLGWIARLVEYIDITNLPVKEFYERGQKLLQKGVCIISFPEGTRSGSRRMGPFTSSIFRLALRARVPLVPLAISGNEMIPPKGSIAMHPGWIRVHKLPAVKPEQYGHMSAYELKNHMQSVLKDHLDQVEGEQE